MSKNATGIENLESILTNQVCISIDQTTATTYNVFIDEDVKEASYYRNLYTILGNASELDTVVFHLSTPGGDADAAVTLCNLIDATDAHTVALIEGEVCSAGTLIIMSCDSVVALPHSCIMIHAAAYGFGGSMNKVKDFVDFAHDRLCKILRDFYEGFLSEEELNDVIVNSRELWISGEEVIQRLENRDKMEREEEAVVLPVPVKKKISKKPINKE